MFIVLFILLLTGLYAYLLNLIPVSNWFLFLWIPLGLILAVTTFAVMFLMLITFCNKDNPKGKVRHFILKSATHLIQWFQHIHVDIEGLENIDPNEAYLIVGNHKSQMDPVMMYNSMGIKLTAIGKSTLFTNRFMIDVAKTYGAISLNRDNDREAVKSLVEAMKRIIDNHLSVIVYPEGGIKSREYEEMRELKAGAYKIALKTHCPVLPVSIIGSSKIMGTPKFKKKNIKIIVHKPITYEEYAEMNTTELGEKCMEIVNSSIFN